MTRKPVAPSLLARRDAAEAVSYYAAETGPAVAGGFVEALQSAYEAVGGHPGAGSLRYAFELHIPDLRVWPLRGYPYLVFYVEYSERVEVWRLLHAKRDLPTFLQEPPF